MPYLRKLVYGILLCGAVAALTNCMLCKSDEYSVRTYGKKNATFFSYNTCEYSVGVLSVSSKKTVKNVNAFDDIKKGRYSEGTLIKTTCYSKKGDGGAATYLIDSKPGEGTVVDIPLESGLYAHLQYGKTVNVAAIGILPDTECSKAVQSAISFFSGKITTLKFNNGVYYFAKQVELASINIMGAQNTVFQVSPEFDSNAWRVFCTDFDIHDKLYNIGINKITFVYETSKNHSLHDKEIVLLALCDISSCSIRNCNFIARRSSENGDFMKCDLLWFTNSDNKNITIDNCKFQNLTGENTDIASGEHLVGGCIWFNGKVRDTNCSLSNVKINNCTIETTVTDEAVGIWNCKCNNININNCKITNSSTYSDNVLTLCNTSTENFKIKSCTFNVNSPAYAVFKFYNIVDASDVSFSSCVFNINTEPYGKEMTAVIVTNDHESPYVNQKKKSVLMDRCTFNTQGTDKYKYLICAYHAQGYCYSLNRCIVNSEFDNAVAVIGESQNCQLDISGTQMNIGNTPEITRGFENCVFKMN